LIFGAPGQSAALDTAERLGLQKSIIDHARNLHQAKENHAEDLLKDLTQQRLELNKDQEEIKAQKENTESLAREQRILTQRLREEEKDFQDKKVYQDFFQRLEDNKKKCVDFIKQETANGKKVWVFGASTKGNVILQYYGLDDSLITAASERSPWKFGRYTVGTNVPIVSEEEARKAQPDYFLVLPYAFFNEMYARETEWRLKGGKWIVPLPEFRVVD